MSGFGGSDALRRLFEIAFTRTAAAETGLNIGKNLAMLGDVDFSDGDDPGVARYLDVGADCVERDQFRALMHARGRRIDARGLTPDIVDRRKSIEQELPYDERLVGLSHPNRVSGQGGRYVRLVKSVVARARFEPHLRQQRALGLAHLGFGRATICGGLS